MSPRAPKKCGNLNCEERVIAKRFCPKHQQVNWPKVEGTPRTSTTEHKAWRLRVLERDGYVCQIKGPTCTTVATEADHVLADAFGGQLTMENGQGACSPCHRAKTQQEAAEGRRRVRQAWEDAQQ